MKIGTNEEEATAVRRLGESLLGRDPQRREKDTSEMILEGTFGQIYLVRMKVDQTLLN